MALIFCVACSPSRGPAPVRTPESALRDVVVAALLGAALPAGACSPLELGTFPGSETGGFGGGTGSSGASSFGGYGGEGGNPSRGGAHSGAAGRSSAGRDSGGSSNTSVGQGAGQGGSGAASSDGGAGWSAGGSADAGQAGEGGSGHQEPLPPPSCRPLNSPICGVAQESCCTTHFVEGGEFLFGGPEDPSSILAFVTGFYLDKYEVSVSRLEAFRHAYDAWRSGEGSQLAPAEGAGEHPLIPGSGWKEEWNSHLPRDGDSLEEFVKTCLGTPFSTRNGASPNLPTNCVSWYLAQGFCIWDGGRLPTELEWEFAAAGGDQNRLFPWGDSAPTPGRAVFGCTALLPDFPCMIPPVGSLPEGAGYFGHLDLAGSVSEWVFDAYGERPNSCVDCASVVIQYPENPRLLRGGSWYDGSEQLLAAYRSPLNPELGLISSGFRCARDSVSE